jgi:hypothetical protein
MANGKFCLNAPFGRRVYVKHGWFAKSPSAWHPAYRGERSNRTVIILQCGAELDRRRSRPGASPRPRTDL